MVKHIQISADHAGRRIDNFLMGYFKTLPRARVYRMIRKGEVRLNKGRVKADYRLQLGDDVRIPPVKLIEKAPVILPAKSRLLWLEDKIIFENSELLVLDKPAGLAVHGGTGVNFGVINALRAIRPEGAFLELVHRLDRDTSGCLMVAKTSSALREMHHLLLEQKVSKHYTALVRGHWNKPKAFQVDLPLLKGQMQSGERMVRVDKAGKAAQTDFRLLKQYPGAALLKVSLHTGRTHQIRVHAAHAGHPVAGDEKYGDTQFNRKMYAIGLRRIFLHASTLSFKLPSTGQTIAIEAPLSDDLSRHLRNLI